MKILSFLMAVMIFIAASCSKGVNGGKPKISISSISNPILAGGDLVATLDFTDGDADLGEGSILSIRTRLNQRPLLPGTGGVDTLSYRLPSFSDNTKGQISYIQPYTYLNQTDGEPDTLVFKFAVTDKAGNISDTISSEKVIVLKR